MAVDLGEITGVNARNAKEKQNPRNINELDNQAFMRLFLEQLKNQDPTAPMEVDKIITQTAQLTQVEMQEQNKKTMQEMAKAMEATKETNQELKEFQSKMKESLEGLTDGIKINSESTQSMAWLNALNSVAMIGKIAETDVFGVKLDSGDSVKFQIYFDEKIDSQKGSPNVYIYNQENELIRTLPLSDYDGKGGYLEFVWDGLNDGGVQAPTGSYNIRAEYNYDYTTNQYNGARVGRGEVQSIIFDKGKPMIRMGDMILPLQSAIEFYERAKSL